jgi:hypothetical protein
MDRRIVEVGRLRGPLMEPYMDFRRELHVKRLRDGSARLDEVSRLNAHHPDFRIWRDRTNQAFGQLFGRGHDHTTRFSQLQFWHARASIGYEERDWSPRDQQLFTEDLHKARRILQDALEELEVALPELPGSDLTAPIRVGSVTPITIKVHNVLAESSHFYFSDLIANLDALGLSQMDRSAAESHARQLEVEIKGQQRWPVLAKSIEALKMLGKPVYENVALPLVLEMLKTQAGL